MSDKKFKVYIGDNYNHVDNPGYISGEYNSFEDAVKACKKDVDSSLNELLNKNLNPGSDVSTPKKLYDLYTNFGSDPWIMPPLEESLEKYEFSARKYAKEKCKKLF